MRRIVTLVVLTASLLASCGGSTEGLFGEQLYQRSCAGCHRADGSGATGPAIGPGSRAALELTDEQIEGVIRAGPGSMPSFSRFSDEQIRSLVVYLRGLQGAGS